MTTARIDRRAISPSRSTGASDQPRATSASSADSSAGASPGFAGAARTVTAAAEGAVSVAVRSERRATIAGVFVAGGTAGVGVDVAEGSGVAVGVAEGAGVSVGTTGGVSVAVDARQRELNRALPGLPGDGAQVFAFANADLDGASHRSARAGRLSFLVAQRKRDGGAAHHAPPIAEKQQHPRPP